MITQQAYKQFCHFDSQHGLLLNIVFLCLGFSMYVAGCNTGMTTQWFSLTNLLILGNFLHMLVRQYLPAYCRHYQGWTPEMMNIISAPPAAPPQPPPMFTPVFTPKLPKLSEAPETPEAPEIPEVPKTPVAPVAPQPLPVTNMGDARNFYADLKGLNGRRVTPLKCGRGYGHYIPGSRKY
jgi:hypothetical protein